jgi:hypothetical protein
MGIEKFFSSIINNKKLNKNNTIKEADANKKVRAKFVGIDYNSIIHTTSQHVIKILNKALYHKLNNGNSKKLLNDEFGDLIDEKEIDEYDENDVDELIIDSCLKKTDEILNEIFEIDKIEELYISIDGIPGTAKIHEQRKRRYMGSLIEELKKVILEKHEKELKNDELRYKYEKTKFKWNKGKITPGTIFMKNFDERMKTVYITELQEKMRMIKTIYYSGPYTAGEGEKKIVNYIRNSMRINDIAIYSPDSDMTLLLMLLYTPTISNNELKEHKPNKIQLVRHNQQKEIYEIIDINQLCDNIYLSVKPRLKNKINQGKFIEDLVFIFTFFGNDFVPKIESIDVKEDFIMLIEKYIEYFNKSNKYIINYYNKDNEPEHIKYRVIDLKQMKEYIEYLIDGENNRLFRKYLSSNFKNYKFIRKELTGKDSHENDFNEKMSKFIDDIKGTFELIRENKKNEIMNKISTKHLNLMTDMVDMGIHIHNSKQLIEEIEAYYNKNKTMPKLQVFRRYQTYYNDKNHLNKIKERMTDETMKITDYDKELFKMENMLDEYTGLFNAISLQMGNLTFDEKNQSFKQDKFEDGVNNYYNTFFETIDPDQVILITHRYIECINNVFDYYFNRYDDSYHTNIMRNLWHYELEKAPLLYTINHVLEIMFNTIKRNENDIITKPSLFEQYIIDKFELTKPVKGYSPAYVREKAILMNDNITSMDEYKKIKNTQLINYSQYPLVHLLITTPLNENLELFPKEYHELLNSQYHIFKLRMNNIANDIINNMNNNYIDCRGVIFLNKCHVELFRINYTKLYKTIPYNEHGMEIYSIVERIELNEEHNILFNRVMDLSIYENYKKIALNDMRKKEYGVLSKIINNKYNKLVEEGKHGKSKIWKKMQEILNPLY